MKKILLLMTGIVLSGIAHAETLALWDGWENNVTNPPPVSALFTGVNSGTMSLVGMSGKTGTTYNDMVAVGGQQTVGLTAILAANKYMSIVVDSDAGQIMNLTRLDLHLHSTILATSSEQRISIFSSVGGWLEGDEIVTYSFPDTASVNQQVNFDLTGGSYDGLTNVEFRLVGYRTVDTDPFNAWGVGNTGGVAADQNIVLNGTLDSAAQRGTLFLVK